MRLTWLLVIFVVVACQQDMLPTIDNLDDSNTAIWVHAEELPVLEIHSTSGIGTLTLNGKIPAEFLVRLHLKGLERFSLQADDMRYELEVGRSGVILSQEGSTPLQLVSMGTGSSAFELSVKLRESADDGQQIKLSWVDFFR